ncbi:hypothetical protein ACVXHB_12760 [Escherichia coli]
MRFNARSSTKDPTRHARHHHNFYSASDDYGDFSNFTAWPIKVDGKTSLAHLKTLFSAQKFLDEKYREEIRSDFFPMVRRTHGARSF